MKFVSAEGMQAGEEAAILHHPELGFAMMNCAGKGLAEAIVSLLHRLDPPHPMVRFLAGPGNNGGDAFAAAVMLEAMDIYCDVWLTCPPQALKGSALEAFRTMEAFDCDFRVVDENEWTMADRQAPTPAILVDALLGTGARGEPRGNVRRAVEYLIAQSGKCLVVSADLPTGMDANTGQMAERAVRADYTVTMGYPKQGMLFPEAQEALGSLRSVEIGLPAEFADAIPDAQPGLQWISEADVRRVFPRRQRASHKGTYGRALLMGGAEQYPGAIVLAAEGAIRSGAGIVRVATSVSAAAGVLARIPEAIVGSDLSADFPLAGFDSILLGSGLGRDPEARRLVARLLRETPCPLVLDADAIAVLAGKSEAIRPCPQPVVLTPHPGELALLLGTDVDAIQRDRLAAAREAAARTGAIVVLKGQGTIVAQAGKAAWINLNGNPGMACGGCGDVLAGLLAGLLAQKIAPLDAACAAAWLHGSAGDLAALDFTRGAMKAGDVAEALSAAFAQVAMF